MEIIDCLLLTLHNFNVPSSGFPYKSNPGVWDRIYLKGFSEVLYCVCVVYEEGVVFG